MKLNIRLPFSTWRALPGTIVDCLLIYLCKSGFLLVNIFWTKGLFSVRGLYIILPKNINYPISRSGQKNKKRKKENTFYFWEVKKFVN